MKRLAIALGALALGGSGALAAECGAPDITGNNASFTGPILNSGGTESCSLTNILSRGDTDRYVVYKIDARGGALLDGAGDSATYTVTSGGETQTTEFAGPYDDIFTVESYFAAGLNPASGFTGDFDVMLSGDFFADIDTLDILVGWTTLADQEDSLTQVAQQQAGLVTHLGAATDLLTGAHRPLEGGDEVGIVGSLGSYTLGAYGRFNLAEGFSVLGGVSAVGLSAGGASASGLVGAAALRFVEPGQAEMRFFGEAGLEVGALTYGFSRTYSDGTVADYKAEGSGDGGLGAIYGRAGILWAPDADNDVVLSATLKQSALGLANYQENMPSADPNLFAADLSGSVAGYTTIKGNVDWTTRIATDVDLTASLGVGTTFGNGGVKGDVFGVGAVTGAARSTIFAEYGLRLGWTPTPATSVDAFVLGTSGTGIGTHAQVGASYRMKF